jgi:hypothetical protein
MTPRDVRDQIWRELPLVRRHLVGRSRVDDLIEVAIDQAPVDLLRHVAGNQHGKDVVLAAWGQNSKRGYVLIRESSDEKAFGPLFWILLSPVLQLILSKLLDWYFRSPQNAVLMRAWKEGRWK